MVEKMFGVVDRQIANKKEIDMTEFKKPEKYERFISSIKTACDAENELTVEI